MAGQTTWNKATVPAGTDPWNGVPDWKKAIDTLNGVVPVATDAERDALTPPGGKYSGITAWHSGANQLHVWDGIRWAGPARGEVASASNIGATTTGAAVVNIPLEMTGTIGQNRRLRVTAQISGSPSQAGVYISYFLKVGGTLGATDGTVIRSTTKRYAELGNGEGVPEFSGRFSSGGGSLRFSLQAQVVGAGTVTHAAGAITLIIDDIGPA